MVRIGDYTAQLEVLEGSGNRDAVEREFDHLCDTVIGASFDDLFSDDYLRIAKMVETPDNAFRMCWLNGYDLILRDDQLVPCWLAFAILILAKAEGLIPTIPTLRKERRLAIKADDLLHANSGPS